MLDVVLDEVEQLSPRACRKAGVEIITANTAQTIEAAAHERSRLSFRDWLCFVVARDEGMEVITNDRPLRSQCRSGGVPTIWGLALMLDLLRGGHLDLERALATAQQIQESNPLHITERVLSEFVRKARAAAGDE